MLQRDDVKALWLVFGQPIPGSAYVVRLRLENPFIDMVSYTPPPECRSSR